MTEEIVISFEPADSDDARQCLAHYYAELEERFDDGFDASRGTPPDPASMAHPNGAFVVVRLDGRPVACGALTTIGEGVGEVKRVWVSPGARGRGIAARVMDTLEEKAFSLGHRTLRLDTNEALAEAQRLYERRGYVPIPAYNDNPYAHHWFERTLPSR